MKMLSLTTGKLLMAAVLVLALMGAVQADSFIKSVSKTDAIQMQGMSQPAQVDTAETWLGKDRAAMVMPQQNMRIVVNTTDEMIYMINETEKTYMEMPLDIVGAMFDEMEKKDQAQADSARAMMDQMAAMINVTVTPTEETKEIKGWQALKYNMVIEFPMGTLNAEVWASTDPEVDWELLRALENSKMALQMPGMEKVTNEMAKIEGATVMTSSVMNMGGQSVNTSNEVLTIETKEPPAGIYAVPEGYQKTASPMDQMMGR